MTMQQLELKSKNLFGLDILSNALIHGDNQKVLRSLQFDLCNKIKCIYIDPPYNNGEKHYFYKDKDSHSNWLKKITSTLRLLKPLLTSDGSLWISIDENEMHYLKVAADSVFGRENFISTIVWQQRTSRENRSIFSNNHEYVLVYSRNPQEFKKNRNLLPLSSEVLSRYKNPDKDERGPWQSVSANVQDGHGTKGQFYEIYSPNGKKHLPPNGRCWCYNEKRMKTEILKNNIWFGKDGNGVPRIKKFLNGAKKGLTPQTLWLSEFAGTNREAKKHFIKMFPEKKIFDTPKPEKLIKQILSIATNENDLVLDCFLGSGSTISTAHKMNRKYIGIEKNEEIIQIAKKRIDLVIDGEEGGISREVNWKGGGEYNFISNIDNQSPFKFTTTF